MSVILILILASLATALLFLGGFIWAVRSGQFDDTFTPSMRVLTDEPTRSVRAPVGVAGGTESQRKAGDNAAPRPALRTLEPNGAANLAKG